MAASQTNSNGERSLKKIAGGIKERTKPTVKFAIIKELEKQYPVRDMCVFLGVSKSGYYKWLKKPDQSAKEKAIVEIIRDVQKTANRTIGYRRMTDYILRDSGLAINKKATLRLMKKYCLLSVTRRKRTFSNLMGTEVYENIINRNFDAARPNEKWLIDMTQIHTYQGFLYCCAIKDCYDGFIVGYLTSRFNNSVLVLNTIKLALRSKRSSFTILHSDQGAQFQSHDYAYFTKHNNILPSMSRVGNCWDNAPMESFFSQLKCECIYLKKKPKTMNEAADLISWYVDFYNNYRLQLKSHLTPAEVRAAYYSSS